MLTQFRRPALAGVIAALLVQCGAARAASPGVARRLYDTGRYDAAQAEYQKLLREKPDDSRLQFNTAAAAYKHGDFPGAALGFEAALTTDNLQLQEQAYYNLANTLYQLGEKAAAPDEKLGHWEQALKHYSSALSLDPKDADARSNQALVQRLVEELKKQMPKDKKKQPNGDKNDKQNKDQDQDKDPNKDDSQKQDSKDQKDSQSGDDKSGDKDQQQQQQQDKQDKQGEDQKDSKDGQQKDQQQQQQQGGDSKDGKDGKDKDDKSRAGQQDQKQKDAQAERDAEEERQAAALGKMTPQMAEKLLDAQKGNEKAMLFRVQQSKSKSKDRIFKDW